ncbi:MAG: MFS transporter, partial [Pararhodobacter sp.]|nr:MFS transporter [Pararhodobacter sp.]
MDENPGTAQVFALMSWRDRRLLALSQAGLVEKFVDALVWVIFPVFLVARGASLTEMSWIVGVYGFVWGGAQLFTGRLSDLVGRFWPNVLGMWVCGAGVLLVVLGEGAAWWSF